MPKASDSSAAAGNILDEDGDNSDWLELQNLSGEDVQLEVVTTRVAASQQIRSLRLSAFDIAFICRTLFPRAVDDLFSHLCVLLLVMVYPS